MSNFDEVRAPDSPKLNPEHYDEAYNHGYALSLQDNPYADEVRHVMNASRHAKISTRKDKDDIMKKRAEYAERVAREHEEMQNPEYKEMLQAWKSKFNKRRAMNELLGTRKRTQSLGGNKNKNKNKKSKRRTNRRK